MGSPRSPYESTRVRHTPKTVIKRGGDVAIHMHGEPACGAANAPGATTVVDVYVNCSACLHLMAERAS